MDRWAEQCQELNASKNTVTDTAVENIISLSVMVDLDIPRSIKELKRLLTPWPAVKL